MGYAVAACVCAAETDGRALARARTDVTRMVAIDGRSCFDLERYMTHLNATTTQLIHGAVAIRRRQGHKYGHAIFFSHYHRHRRNAMSLNVTPHTLTQDFSLGATRRRRPPPPQARTTRSLARHQSCCLLDDASFAPRRPQGAPCALCEGATRG